MQIKLSSVEDARALSHYYQRNEKHLAPWEPLRQPGFHARAAWAERLKLREREQREGRGFYFLTYDTERQAVIASCSLTGVALGPFQAGYMGYSVDGEYEGQGVMKRLCRHVIDYAFSGLRLNRIMANYMPNNERSARLLHSLGFEKEGYARNYLLINGKWEDHVLSALLNPNNRQSAGSGREPGHP